MKRILISLIVFIQFFSLSQSTGSILAADQLFRVSSGGNISIHTNNSEGNSIRINKSTGFWVNAIDENNFGHGSIIKEYSNDFANGVMSSNFESSEYIAKFRNKIWTVSLDDINNLIDNGVVSPHIERWPAHGSTETGTVENIAPFVDVNGDGLYEPMNGDYPCIKGDKACYLILNDINHNQNIDYLAPLGVEVHIFAYQFDEANVLGRTTFIETMVINKSENNYHDVNIGFMNDFDIGNLNDDYMGSDSINNLIYAYNADLLDEGGNSFGTSPPVCGMRVLNKNAHTINTIKNQTNVTPLVSNHYLNFMNGFERDGTPYLSDNGTVTKFTFNSQVASSNTELSNAAAPGDRIGLISTKNQLLNAGDTIKTNFAIIHRKTDNPTSTFDAISDLIVDSEVIQNFYDNMSHNCVQTTSINENETLDFEVYPNPANHQVNIQVEGQFQIELLDSKGSLIFTKSNCFGQEQIIVSQFDKGLYFIQVKTEKGIQSEKLIIE